MLHDAYMACVYKIIFLIPAVATVVRYSEMQLAGVWTPSIRILKLAVDAILQITFPEFWLESLVLV